MLNAFITLFSRGGVAFYILFVIALILIICEALESSFGILGLGGILFGFGAIVARCFETDNTSTEIALYVFYIIALLVAAMLIVKLFKRLKRITKRTKAVAEVDGVEVPLTSEGNLDYSFLLGKEGEVVSDLKPLGKVKIDDQIYEATTAKGYIYSGAKIKVDKVIAQRIIVIRKG